MTAPRKRYSAEIKEKVALEAIKGNKMINEIASEYGVHATQNSLWKSKHWMNCLPFFNYSGVSRKKMRRPSPQLSIKKSVN